MLVEAVIFLQGQEKGRRGMPSSMRYEYKREEISERPRDREGRFECVCRETRNSPSLFRTRYEKTIKCVSLSLDVFDNKVVFTCRMGFGFRGFALTPSAIAS